jgi:hypothetical protein
MDRKPLFAMIPYFGGSWSVNYTGDTKGTSIRSGSGDFPVDRFPNIPVVDCRTVRSFAGFPDFPVEHYGTRSTVTNRPTMPEFMEQAAQCGATISYLDAPA